jgi:hypothetical protein
VKLVYETETRTFTDAEGDQLITLRAPKKRHLDKRDNLIINMANIDIKDPNNPTVSDIKIDQSVINEFMFKAVARKMVIGGVEISGEKLIETYLDLAGESGTWIDTCITEIWGETKEVKNG